MRLVIQPPPLTLALGHAEGNSAVTYGLDKETSVLTQCCSEKHSDTVWIYGFISLQSH